MTKRWIFQDIADIESAINAMSDMKKLFNQSIGVWLKEYAARERKMLQGKQIPWTTYAGFCLHKKRHLHINLTNEVRNKANV